MPDNTGSGGYVVRRPSMGASVFSGVGGLGSVLLNLFHRRASTGVAPSGTPNNPQLNGGRFIGYDSQGRPVFLPSVTPPQPSSSPVGVPPSSGTGVASVPNVPQPMARPANYYPAMMDSFGNRFPGSEGGPLSIARPDTNYAGDMGWGGLYDPSGGKRATNRWQPPPGATPDMVAQWRKVLESRADPNDRGY